MKYIYSTVLFLIFIFFITSLIDFNYIKEVENIDMSDNQIDKIAVDLIDANVSLSTTVDKDIKIEHIYSKENQPTSNLYTYQKGHTLYVNEYPYNKSNLISKKETINIYIPEEYVFDELDILTASGQINVDSLSTDTLEIVTDSGNVDVANISTTDMSISGGQFGVSLSNIVAKKVNAEIDKAEMIISNSIIDELNVTNALPSNLTVNRLVTNVVNVFGADTAVNLTLNDQLDYIFNTPAPIGNPQVVPNENGYEYLVNGSKTLVEYNLPDAKTVAVTFEVISEKTDKDE